MRMPKVETVSDVDDENEVQPFVPIVPKAEPSQIPEPKAVNANGKPIYGMVHLDDTFVNMEVKLSMAK